MSNWFNCKSEVLTSSCATTFPIFTGLKEREREWSVNGTTAGTVQQLTVILTNSKNIREEGPTAF